eukprot:COSAG05_NODE_17590_length_323_cov_0.477679_1_plen_75_part_01
MCRTAVQSYYCDGPLAEWLYGCCNLRGVLEHQVTRRMPMQPLMTYQGDQIYQGVGGWKISCEGYTRRTLCAGGTH